MEEKKKLKQFILRMPPELHEWLKANVEEGKINDYLVDLLKTHIQSLKPSEQKEEEEKPRDLEKEWLELQKKLTPKVIELLKLRQRIMTSPDYAKFKKDFEDMEYTYDPDNDAGKFYDPEKFSEEAKAYYQALEELSKSHYAVPLEERSQDSDFLLLFHLINLQDALKRERELRIMFRGNPDEVVWRDVTRADIYSNFEKGKGYSIMVIASKLGLNYQDCYQHVIPWMRKEGFTFEAER
jgi:hypothetical protein